MSQGFDAGAAIATLGLDMGPFERGYLRAEGLMNIFPQSVAVFMADPLLGIVSAAKAAGEGLAGMFRAGIVDAATLEQTRIAFETMLGSASAAQTMLADLNTFAAETPFALPGINAAAKSLLAFKFEAESIVPNLRMLGDLSAALNIPLTELAEIYGKAKVQGRLMMEDINQLTGRGIPVISAFAEQFSVAESEVRNLVSTGQIGFENLEKALQGMTGAGGQFQDLTKKQSQSLGGLWSTLVDNAQMTRRDVTASLLAAFDAKGLVSRAIEMVNAVQPVLVGFADTVGPVMADAIGSAVDQVMRLGPAFTFVADHAETFGLVAATVGGLLASNAVAGAFVALAPTIMGLVMPLNVASMAVRGLSVSLGVLVSPIGIAVAAAAGLYAVLTMAPEKFGPFAGAVETVQVAAEALWRILTTQLVPAIGQQLTAAWAALQPYLPTTAGMFDTVQGAMAAVAGFVTGTLIPAVGEGLVAAINLVGPMIPIVSAALASLGQAIVQVGAWIWGTAVPAIVDGLAAAWAFVQPGVATAGEALGWIWGVMTSVIDWIVNVGAPTVGGVFASAWTGLQPILQGVGDVMSAVWDLMAGYAAFVIGELVPIVGKYLAGAWGFLQPVLTGVGQLVAGLWDLWVGLTAHITDRVIPVVAGVLGPVLSHVGSMIRFLGDTLGWLWKNVLSPVVNFAADSVVWVLEKIGGMLGWLIGRIGSVLSALGRAIGGTRDLAKEAAGLPGEPERSGGLGAGAGGAGGAIAAAPSGPTAVSGRFEIPAIPDLGLDVGAAAATAQATATQAREAFQEEMDRVRADRSQAVVAEIPVEVVSGGAGGGSIAQAASEAQAELSAVDAALADLAASGESLKGQLAADLAAAVDSDASRQELVKIREAYLATLRSAGGEAFRGAAEAGARGDELGAVRDQIRETMRQAAIDSRLQLAGGGAEAAAQATADAGRTAGGAASGFRELETSIETVPEVAGAAEAAMRQLGDYMTGSLLSGLQAVNLQVSAQAAAWRAVATEMDGVLQRSTAVASASGAPASPGAGGAGGVNVGNVNVGAPNEGRLARMIAGEVEGLIDRKLSAMVDRSRAGAVAAATRGGL